MKFKKKCVMSNTKTNLSVATVSETTHVEILKYFINKICRKNDNVVIENRNQGEQAEHNLQG